MIILYWLSLIIFVLPIGGVSVPRWEAKDSYIMNTLKSENIEVENLLKSPTKNMQPIVSIPTKEQRTLKNGEIPQYAIDFAPLVHLYTEERYLPYDIKDYVAHFYATYSNGSVIEGTEKDLDLEKLSELPNLPDIYLTSRTDFSTDPYWVTGVKNKPSLIDGEIKDAPATLIIVDKGNGWVDAFWFYFYSFNLGPFVMGSGPYGNHVGDWEHSLVRFYNGQPVIVWMSAHGGGGAYFYHNLEKWEIDSNHPIIFSARGTHANYVSVGQHPHDLPYGILSDFTDRGPLWNPTKNYLGYSYDGNFVYPTKNNANSKHRGREEEYGNWLSFTGNWGDKKLTDDDPRQQHLFIGGYKYIDGPHGPLTKNLVRLKTCERNKWWNFWNGCNVRENIKWGIGIESEGYNCGNVFLKIKPVWFRKLLQKVTWGGGFCFIVDIMYG